MLISTETGRHWFKNCLLTNANNNLVMGCVWPQEPKRWMSMSMLRCLLSNWSNKYLKNQRWKNPRIALIGQCFSTMQQTERQTHGVTLLIIKLKIKIGKAVEFGGSAKRDTYVYVRFASWSKFPIWQRPLYLVADDKKFLRSSRKVSLTSGLTLSDIIEKQLLYNISAPAVLILHLAATGDRARVVFARLALGNSAFCFFAVWPKFSAAGPAGCRFSCLISSRTHCTPAF